MGLFKNKSGFTLTELLIVMAIIAVMSAISIPLFQKELESGREAADLANLRSAKACAFEVFTESDKNAGVYYYDAGRGILVPEENGENPLTVGYGKGTRKVGTNNEFQLSATSIYDENSLVAGKVIKVTILPYGDIEYAWVNIGETEPTD